MPSSAKPHLFQTSAEPVKDPLHVPPFLHGDDPGVILLINPNQKVLLIVVPGQKCETLINSVIQLIPVNLIITLTLFLLSDVQTHIKGSSPLVVNGYLWRSMILALKTLMI